jgi:hypothetical protein
VGVGGIGAASGTGSTESYDIGGVDGGILKPEIVASSAAAGTNSGVGSGLASGAGSGSCSQTVKPEIVDGITYR